MSYVVVLCVVYGRMPACLPSSIWSVNLLLCVVCFFCIVCGAVCRGIKISHNQASIHACPFDSMQWRTVR